MTDANVNSPAPRKRRGWLKILAGLFGALVLFLVVAYFVVTSSGFLKSMILPRVSKALNAEVTVSDASISPFSQVVLHNLKVQTTGTEPLVTATQARLRYHLMDILGGNIHVDEVTLTSPTVTLVENPDGTSNLDPITKAQTAEASKSPKPAQPTQPSKPTQIDLKKLALTDATVRQIKLYKNGNRDVVELSKVNLTVDDVKNGQTGKAALSAEVLMQNNPPAPGAAGMLQAKVNGSFTFALTADLKPAAVKGNTHLEVARAEGALAQAARLAGDLDCDLTPTDIKQVALQFQREGKPLGQIRVSGPFDLQKTEGRIAVEVRGIDKQLLNVAGAGAGLDFGPTTLNSTNEIQLAKAGSLITAAGQLQLNRFQVTRTNQATPQFDLATVYSVTVDRAQSNAQIRVLTLNGTQQGQPLLQGSLTSPMTIAWGKTDNALGDSAFNLTVNRLNLADWHAFLGDAAQAGLVNVQAKILSQRGGSHLAYDVDSHITGLDAAAGTNRIRQADLALQLKGTATDLKQFELSQCQLQISRKNQPLLTLGTTGTFNATNQNADLQLTLEATLARLLEVAPQPDLSVSAGTASLKTHLTQKDNTQTVSGNLTVADLSARFGTNQFNRFGLTSEFDLSLATSAVQIRKLAGQVSQAATPALTYSVSGSYNLTNQDADLQLALQATLARLLEAMPQPDVHFTAGTIEVKGHVVQLQKKQAVTGTLAVADLTGAVAKNQFRQYGLTADLDLGLTPQEVQIRKLTGKLTEGANPGGAFDIAATYEITNHAAQFTAKLSGFNQNGLRPFLEPLLADKQLVSVALNVNATGKYDPQGDASVKGDLQLANLVVKDPKGQLPAKPLEAQMQVDASILKQVADIRQFALTLTPTARATNQLVLTGRLDMTRTNMVQGNLKLAADSLDLTSYYDLFAAQAQPQPATQPATKTSGRATPTPRSTTTPAPGPEQELEVVQLPFSNFVAQATLRRLYLREVEIADLDTSTRIDVSHVVVKPLKLSLNGAPVDSTLDLDLSVPGYKYDVAFNAQKIPLTPLVNSFAPESKGKLGGALTAQTTVKGAGITGASLQKNLTGKFDITTTNLNLSVVNIQNKILRTIINVVATIPDLIRNPSGGASAALGTAWGAITGTQAQGGLAGDLEKSPIDAINVHGEAGSGQINLRQTMVQSSKFQATANGTVTLASVLTNSTLQIPIGITLSQPIAQRINMVPANTPTNQAYVALPDFFTLVGTVGNPQKKINYLALAGGVVKGVGGLGTSAGSGTANNIIQGLGGILGNTNAPGTNAGSKASGLLQGLGNILTAPATNAPSNTATNQTPAGGLLNQLLNPNRTNRK